MWPHYLNRMKLISRCCLVLILDFLHFRLRFLYILVSSFCFLLYMLSPYLKHYLTVVRISAPVFIRRIHVHLSLNHKYRIRQVSHLAETCVQVSIP